MFAEQNWPSTQDPVFSDWITGRQLKRIDFLSNVSAGMIRRTCIPRDLLESSKDNDKRGKDKVEGKQVEHLEAALREAAGAIHRHDTEIRKMIDRIQELESQQNDSEKSMKIVDMSVFSPEKSYERDLRLVQTPQMKLSTTEDNREVTEDREKSYLVGASVSQSVDLRTAQMPNSGEQSNLRSSSQSHAPMGVLPPHTIAQKDKMDIAMSPLMSVSHTADTSPVPGPASVAASLRVRCVGGRCICQEHIPCVSQNGQPRGARRHAQLPRAPRLSILRVWPLTRRSLFSHTVPTPRWEAVMTAE